MKHVTIYCPKCGRETVHAIWSEDFFGAKGISRVFTAVLSCGATLVGTETYCKCLSCGRTKTL